MLWYIHLIKRKSNHLPYFVWFNFIKDTSPNALTKAFLLVSGVLVPDPDSGEEKTYVRVEKLVKAFDEHQEIIIDIYDN
jgi:hypothetical protein